MGAPRRRNLINSRRRVEDDGEEEEGSVVADIEEDSLSDGSAISDADDDADAEGSDGDNSASPVRDSAKPSLITNGHRNRVSEVARQPEVATLIVPDTSKMGDTEAMMNGLSIKEAEEEGVAFENMGEQLSRDVAQDPAKSLTTCNIGEKRRREHEEYKRKRDADPAFVPNRGGFFMHDHRSAAPGQNGFRPFGSGRGRGRGRGSIGDSFHSPGQPLGPADSPWAHDLHETVAQPDIQTSSQHFQSLGPSLRNPTGTAARHQPPNRSFSKTIRIGNVQIRVFIGGMTDPILFSAVPVNQYTRLPQHRPPLRRDKPVRISLPDMPIRYIFPSTDCSFIFIPRALRPNQQGFGRVRGRGSFGGAYSAMGGLSSRRTSAYAGSAYSPSIAQSRRSSFAREISAEVGIQAGGAALHRMAPVVRLPPAAEQAQLSDQKSIADVSTPPTVNLPQPSAYPVPQKPTLRENRPSTLPMQHPKPQRTLQVADIDSPATLEFNPPQQQQQLPFHQQVPPQITEQSFQMGYPHSRHPSHPSQTSGATPLPQIPDRAIHAQPFHPYTYQPPPAFFQHQFPPPMYYYPPLDQVTGAPSASAAAFVPGQQFHYPLPVATVPPPPAASEAQTQQSSDSNTQGGTVAQEINGMVYYLDPSQVAANAENAPHYASTGYTMPPPGGVVGIGGMMTPPMYYLPPPPPPAFYQ